MLEIGEFDVSDIKEKLPEEWFFQKSVLSSDERMLLLENSRIGWELGLIDLECKHVHDNICPIALLKKIPNTLKNNSRLILVLFVVREIIHWRNFTKYSSLKEKIKLLIKSYMRSVLATTLFSILNKFSLCYVRKLTGTSGRFFLHSSEWVCNRRPQWMCNLCWICWRLGIFCFLYISKLAWIGAQYARKETESHFSTIL